MAGDPLLGQDAKARFAELVRDVEARTGAEVMIVMRPRAPGLDTAPGRVGASVSLATLIFLLYSPPVFALWGFVLLVPLAYIGGSLVPGWSGWARRAFTSRAERHVAVTRAARSAFVELEICNTRARGGVLIYVSVDDRIVAIVPDSGLRDVVATDAWLSAARNLESALEGSDPAHALATAVETLGNVLERTRPRTADDIDELGDVVW